MRNKTKIALAASFVGVVVTAATAFAQTATPRAPSNSDKTTRSADGCGGGKIGRREARLVHSDTKVKTPNGFATIAADQGKVTAIDKAAKKITIKRADGQTVTATAVDKTQVCKDGKKSTFDSIKVGDLARLFQVRSEKFTGLRRIAALTPGAAQSPARGEGSKAASPSPARAA